mmetsp:Transcript_9200/g.29301  ORF Transcript_9200/g.29301 Transcript_9200/m.29301 type:complete len:220 (+) Transcript_9200:46-705(+)
MGLFGSKNKQISATDRAVLDLKISRDKLKALSAKYEAQEGALTSLATDQLRRGDRARAKKALQRRAGVRATYDRAVNQLDNVEATLASVESAKLTSEIAASLKAGNAAIKELHAKLGGLEGVENLMLETEDAIADQAAIDEALGADADALAGLSAADLDEIEAELASLGEAEAAASPAADALAGAPAVPATDLPATGDAARPADAAQAAESRQAEALPA